MQRMLFAIKQELLSFCSSYICIFVHSVHASSMEGRRFLELSRDEDFHAGSEDVEVELDSTLPSTEDVILRTEQVTKNIQELLRAAQEFKHDR